MSVKVLADTPEQAALRLKFETQARDSFNFKRSRKGTYVNPAIARDWKWFQLGAQALQTTEKDKPNV